MIVRATLFDADGVTLKRKGYFSEHLAEEFGIPLEKIMPFFRSEFRAAQTGKTDIRDSLPGYLAEWGWKDGLDAFLLHWFMFDAQLDEQVVERVLALRGAGIPCYLVSDQEKHRGSYLKTTLALGALFDGCFFSYELGLLKNDPAFFREVLRQLDIPAKDTRYYDDDPKNIDVAAGVGIDARFYTGPSDIE